MALAAQTVETFLQLPARGKRIDAVAQINFDGFAKVIDTLGGITINVPQPIVDDDYPTADFGTTRIEFKAGVQKSAGASGRCVLIVVQVSPSSSLANTSPPRLPK